MIREAFHRCAAILLRVRRSVLIFGIVMLSIFAIGTIIWTRDHSVFTDESRTDVSSASRREFLVMKDQDGSPISDIPYRIETADGKTVAEGLTGRNGETQSIPCEGRKLYFKYTADEEFNHGWGEPYLGVLDSCEKVR